MLQIIKAPNPVLSQKAKRIAKIDKAVLRLISQMQEALEASVDPIGVGLAAPQVGKSLQLFIAKPTPKSKILVFINPKIIRREKKTDSGTSPKNPKEHKKLEGCLSLKDIWGEVERFDSIRASYLDETGKKHQRKFNGFLATIFQHEIDHLNGTLFPKRVLEQKGTLYKSEKDEKGRDVFDEIKI
jgi:peptide deformylase